MNKIKKIYDLKFSHETSYKKVSNNIVTEYFFNVYTVKPKHIPFDDTNKTIYLEVSVDRKIFRVILVNRKKQVEYKYNLVRTQKEVLEMLEILEKIK